MTETSTGTSTGASSAKERAQEAASTATEQGKQLGSVAKEEMGSVAGEATTQARRVAGEAVSQLTSQLGEQTRSQKDQLVSTLRTFGDDLESMAQSSQGGLAADLAREVADRARGLVSSVENREPADLLDDVRHFARRRPGAFLLGALTAGMVAGRMARGMKDAASGSAGLSGAAGTSYGTGYRYSDTSVGSPGNYGGTGLAGTSGLETGSVGSVPPAGVPTAPMSTAGTGASLESGADDALVTDDLAGTTGSERSGAGSTDIGAGGTSYPRTTP